jgi:hypothetical protein
MNAGGRPKKVHGGLTIGQWLRGYLSGGSRPSREIEKIAELRGVKWSTVTRAKKELGCIDAVKVGHVFHWIDRTVPNLKVDEPRLAPVPAIDLTVKPEDRASVEEPPDGFSDSFPSDLGLLNGEATVAPAEIEQYIVHLLQKGQKDEVIVRTIFEFAYPAADLSESTIVRYLRRKGVSVPRRELLLWINSKT